MGATKQICCSIMICQMTAILSGVSLMYLTVIVIGPSVRELEFNFNNDPIMCTTIKANDIATGGKKVDCKWSTCHEWCLSKVSSPCMQIYVMPRIAGTNAAISQCEFVSDMPCSALNITKTDQRLCKKGECKDMSGLFNCSKLGENVCKDITPAYNCTGGSLRAVNKTNIICNQIKCKSRLNGVYLCASGVCNKIEDKDSYRDCERKCENLDLKKANTILFSKERLITAKCSFANSTSESLYELNNNPDWKNDKKKLFIFCSTADIGEGEDGKPELNMEDCFNATLRDGSTISNINSYLELINVRDNTPPNTPWLLEAEETLRVMNDTMLRINTRGCVNSLIRECHAFFLTHATDGKDGKTRDRFPCYFSNLTSEFVVGNFDPETTYMYLLLGSIVPAILFVVSCLCLFFCSKSVGVDEGGHLKVTLLKNASNSGNANFEPSILL